MFQMKNLNIKIKNSNEKLKIIKSKILHFALSF